MGTPNLDKIHNQWWGYIHENGSLQVKRYWDRADLQEARESPFVSRVYGPWPASSREEALGLLKKADGA
jgi:hypothetical protein